MNTSERLVAHQITIDLPLYYNFIFILISLVRRYNHLLAWLQPFKHFILPCILIADSDISANSKVTGLV